MSDFRDEIVFFGSGLNTDDDLRVMPKGDSPYRLNVIPSQDGNHGTLTNIKGNESLGITLPAGDNTVIGSCQNVENDSVIFFIYNASGNHAIIEYNPILKILVRNIAFNDSTLNFSLESRIQSSVINNYLFFTDGFDNSGDGINPPRMIDLTSSVPSASRNEYFYQLGKLPPWESPRVEYISDVTTDKNSLRGSFYQFRTRYIYDDFTKSSWSPISKVAIPQGEYYFNGDSLQPVSVNDNNVIQIQQQVFNSSNGVKRPDIRAIEIAVRIGNVNDWLLVDTLNLEDYNYTFTSQQGVVDSKETNYMTISSSNPAFTGFYVGQRIIAAKVSDPSVNVTGFIESLPDGNFSSIKIKFDDTSTPLAGDDVSVLGQDNFRYHFDGNKQLQALDQGDTSINFFSVPQHASALEIIEDNRLVLGDIQEGYDNVDIDVSLSLKEIACDFNDTGSFPVTTEFVVISGVAGFKRYFTVDLDSESYIRVNYTSLSPDFIYSIAKGTLTNSEVAAKIVGAFNDSDAYEFLPRFRYAQLEGNDVVAIYSSYPEETEELTATYAPIIKTKKGLKQGCYHKFGMVYYDEQMRSGGVLTNDACALYVPHPGDDDYSGTKIDQYYQANFEVNHNPPSWAKYWQWVYLGNASQKYFLQFRIDTGVGSISDVDNGIRWIDVAQAITNTDEDIGGVSWEYTYRSGDRIRVYGIYDGTSSLVAPDSVIDIPIQREDEGKIYFSDDDIFTTNFNTVVEIYTPNTQPDLDGEGDYETVVFREIGEVHYVGTNGYHTINGARDDGTASWRSQSASRSCKGVLETGDSYMYNFSIYSAADTIVAYEHSGIWDCLDSKITDIGRFNVTIPTAEQERYSTLIRYGGQFIDNTQANFLNKFESGNQKVLGETYGKITSMTEVGYTLKVLQQKKEVSIPVGRYEQQNPDGSTTYVATNSVLGTQREAESNRGCQFGSAPIKNDRYLYYIDLYRGEAVRSAANGQQVISDAKMSAWFDEKKKTLLNSGVNNISIISAWDKETDMIYFTFLDSTDSDNNDTIGWHEESKRWISFYSFKPEWYQNMQGYLVSFVDGQAWLHNSDTADYNTFYNSIYGVYVDIVSNSPSNMIKVFDSIEVASTGNSPWSAPLTGDVEIITNEDSTRFNGLMQSRLKTGAWKRQEGLSRADFKRDMLTSDPNTASVDDLFNGRFLRGQEIRVRLGSSGIEEVNLFRVVINSTRSA